jgi:hypothetical protein
MPPVIIGAGIAAAATVGGAVLTSKSNAKATDKAVAAQQTSETQQLGFQRQARDENTAALSQWMERGNAAGNQINALLGLGGPTQAQPTPQAGVLAQYQGPFEYGGNGVYPPGDEWGFDQRNRDVTYGGQGTMTAAPGHAATPAPAQTPQQAALAAYDIFKQSTGYQTRLKEGQSALTANYFGGGVGQSGAAMKAAIRFGNDYAGNYFDNYLGQLGNQQSLGFSGASALAGVGQTFANNASNISQNGANVASEAAIARARNNGAVFTGLAGAAGQFAGALSSYGQPQLPQPSIVAPGFARGGAPWPGG